MSKHKLTDSQQQFVDIKDKNTLVSASAGSGKTSTMIAKLTKLITEGVPLNKLLIVTYTNAAGSEMRQKLFNSLISTINESSDEALVDFISSQLDEMSNADIGTLHSVCKKIISTYFYVVGVDPAFTLLTEQENDYLFDRAMDNVFNKLIIDNDSEFYAVYTLYNRKRNLNNLKQVVKTLNNYLLSKVDAEVWQKYVIESCSNGGVAKDYLLEYYKSQFLSFKSEILHLKNQCLEICPQLVDYVSDRLNFIFMIENIENYEELVLSINNYEFIKKPSIKSDKLSPEILLLSENASLLFDNFSAILTKCKENCVNMDKISEKNYVSLVISLFKLQKLVAEEFDRLKKQQNALNFSDLEHITLKILENDNVKTALKEKYQYIFVDEYQDINQVQEEIISRIKRDNNLYMIGDVKQSIYAFRLSNPEIFINKYNTFQVDNKLNAVIDLNENFRSAENILEFSNLIFNCLITKETIGIDYEKNSQLVAGLREDFKSCVSMDLINGDEEESTLIARKVAELVNDGFNFKDIAILLRSKNDLVGEVYNELKKYNIPVDATYKTDLFKNNEVLVIYYLLKLINNSFDDLAMATVLKSPMIDTDDEELAEIRRLSKDLKFFECVYEYLKQGKNPKILKKIEKMFNILNDLRFKLASETIKDTLDYLINKYDIFNHYLSFANGLEKVTNLKEFLRLVSNDEYRYDLQGCLDYLDSVKKDGVVTLTMSSVSDSVKIMTIHSSKGLEFPAVILGGVGKKFVLNKNTEDIIINDTLGVGVKSFDKSAHTEKPSLVANACKLKNKVGEIDEEIRLLYVALTRAKNRLCIVGKYDTKNIRHIANKDVYSCSCYMDLMAKAMPKDCLQYFENKEPSFVVNGDKKSVFSVNIHQNLDLKMLEIRPLILDFRDEMLEQELISQFEYVYPLANKKNIAIKNSVSQVLREEVDYENHVDSLTGLEQEDDQSLKLGTAYHSIMQNLNFSENLAEIQQLIDAIKTPDLPYDKINPNEIYNATQKLSKLIAPDSQVLKEAQFVMKTNYGKISGSEDNIEVLIQGVIDLAIINNNSAIIVDYKTNRTKNRDYLIKQYGIQLKLYSEAFEKAYKIKVENRYLYSFQLNDFIEI